MTSIAVTGATGVIGYALIELLEADPNVERIVALGRRPFDPESEGWTKTTYRRADVRDLGSLYDAFERADAVAHLAFAIYGYSTRARLWDINVGGTMNAFSAAAAAGVRRFVHASSVAAYGVHPDNPIGIDESWPIRGSTQLFYAAHKAEAEQRLHAAAAEESAPALTVFRPVTVVGGHGIGFGHQLFPRPYGSLARAAGRWLSQPPVPLPLIVPPQPLQFVHEDDVANAFRTALIEDVPPGAYNLGGDGVVRGEEFVREMGYEPLPVPDNIARAVAGAVLQVRCRPALLDWYEVALHPLVVDASRAKQDLGWKAAYTSREALRDMLGR